MVLSHNNSSPPLLVYLEYSNIPSLEQYPIIKGTLWYFPDFRISIGSSLIKAGSFRPFSIASPKYLTSPK